MRDFRLLFVFSSLLLVLSSAAWAEEVSERPSRCDKIPTYITGGHTDIGLRAY